MLLPVGDGSGGGQTLFERSEPLATNCGSAAGVAKRVKEKLNQLTSDGNSLPSVEYGGAIIKVGDRFELYKDQLLTYDASGVSPVRISSDPVVNRNVVGFVHNHPAEGDQNQLLLNRYPSVQGWARADYMVQNESVPANMSLYIIDSRGSIREFRYFDKSSYTQLSDQQKIVGDILPPLTISNSDCVDKS